MRYTIKQKEGEIMELRVLRYFLAVAREENITAAAESLHVTQPTLSKQLMDLEAQLGKTLFFKRKKKNNAYGRRDVSSKASAGNCGLS